ncbi:MAG: hypothetical protein Q9192_002574 [Flavoplaca navasiana]
MAVICWTLSKQPTVTVGRVAGGVKLSLEESGVLKREDPSEALFANPFPYLFSVKSNRLGVRFNHSSPIRFFANPGFGSTTVTGDQGKPPWLGSTTAVDETTGNICGEELVGVVNLHSFVVVQINRRPCQAEKTSKSSKTRKRLTNGIPIRKYVDCRRARNMSCGLLFNRDCKSYFLCALMPLSWADFPPQRLALNAVPCVPVIGQLSKVKLSFLSRRPGPSQMWGEPDVAGSLTPATGASYIDLPTALPPEEKVSRWLDAQGILGLVWGGGKWFSSPAASRLLGYDGSISPKDRRRRDFRSSLGGTVYAGRPHHWVFPTYIDVNGKRYFAENGSDARVYKDLSGMLLNLTQFSKN